MRAPRFADYPEFLPYFSVEDMLEIGVFEGEYFEEDMMTLTPSELAVYELRTPNYFADHVGSSRQVWIDAGWIHEADPLGWFHWFQRFSKGRRLGAEDARQIGRWKSFGARHGAQVMNAKGDINKRRRQRQSLLHWSHNPIPDIEAH
jgi:hypothetical protein